MRCSGKPSMIHHLSIAARGPKHAADILAKLMGGVAMPLPPNPWSFSHFSSTRTDRVSGFIPLQPSWSRAAVTAGAL
jgi:hypothetical protein